MQSGYSGGGHAAGWAAQLANEYAPELNIIGAALGGVPADLKVSMHQRPRVAIEADPLARLVRPNQPQQESLCLGSHVGTRRTGERLPRGELSPQITQRASLLTSRLSLDTVRRVAIRKRLPRGSQNPQGDSHERQVRPTSRFQVRLSGESFLRAASTPSSHTMIVYRTSSLWHPTVSGDSRFTNDVRCLT